MEDKKKSVKSLYDSHKPSRHRYLRRAYECAKLTIPALIPDEKDRTQRNEDIALEQPWQSVGSIGVNTLTAKMVMTLLPSNSPFFMMRMSKEAREEVLQLEGEEAEKLKAEIDSGLQRLENEIADDMETTKLRTNTFSIMKHLIVSGNALVNVDTANCYSLRDYIVKRDRAGNTTLVILREMVSKKTLDPRFVTQIEAKVKAEKQQDLKEDLEIYTIVELQSKDRWVSYQEIEGEEVPGTRGTYNNNSNPWLPLRMISVDGEDYGRSYVEELYGDLMSAEELTKSIVQGGMIASKLLWLVNPNGLTDVDDLNEAENGDFASGREEDVNALRADKLADFQVAERVLQTILNRLERAFLMNSSVQRDAERVTAYELQIMAGEIEDVLGGYYSLMAQEFQLPLVKRWMQLMMREGKLPDIPAIEGYIEPIIITGTEALGRGQDLNRLRGFSNDLMVLAGAMPEILQRLNHSELITRIANGHNIDTSGLVKSDAEIAAEQQQQQEAAMAQALVDKGTAPAISAMANQSAAAGQ